jgi:phosphoglycerate dehydrogenase-like enzyme
MPMTTSRIAVASGAPGAGPSGAGPDWAVDAVRDGGGEPVGLGQPADGLIWVGRPRADDLRRALADQPGVRWVQLPVAGVEAVADGGLFADGRVWTSAKGLYAGPVAEHALALALAGLRVLPDRIRATSWGREGGTSLYGRRVTILGGGGITEELLRLLAPFGVEATVVRRRADPLRGAARTVPTSQLHEVLPGALVVFLALALTPATVGIIGAGELALMDADAILVNVARGRHVDSNALADALAAGRIAGAGLDVTDPEPLPDGHRLWAEPRCIVTPHTADTWEMVRPLLSGRIRTNVGRFVAGEPLEGLVDVAAGY